MKEKFSTNEILKAVEDILSNNNNNKIIKSSTKIIVPVEAEKIISEAENFIEKV
jgi:hypothetical protein